MKVEILDLLKEIGNQEEIQISDIPMLDLYMDQVITLFENKLEKGKRSEKDKLLTKTMINNYVKDQILMPAKNKRYTPEHLIMMAFIYHLKQTLSINDIKILFTETIYKEEIDLFALYNRFLDVKKQEQRQIEKEVQQKIEALHIDQSQEIDIMMMVLSLVSSANTQKRLAEKLIDTYLIKGDIK
ncbi:MAG TPA: DUF1836 domain-containing protein [Epulopiscium sp.]|nr:DUF1836 domain-containing protein [Candidatus Epulonipiscium sp.]